ncbi:unnamed protein product [Ectocarpus sp. 4 AP-2014]
MKKPTAQEVKRKICSKIFELQSSLLAEDVGEIDEALLRECAAWFCPQHLQDIVIERSEAEGRCGWPGCGNKLPSWRLAAPLVFDLPEGEQLGRFCERSCMAKTKVFMSAIPPTPPYTRENLVRLACPPPAPSSAEGSTGVNGDGHGAAGAGAKKVYKRARRRDLPPPKERLPVGAAAAAAAGSVVADNAGEGAGVDRQEGGSEKSAGEEAPTFPVPEKQAADEQSAASSPAAVSDKEGNEERVGTPAEASDIASGSSGRGEGVATVTAVPGEGAGADASGEDARASVRASLESVSISAEEEKDACSAVASSAPVVAAAAAATASPAPPASDVADVREATSTTAVKAPAPVPTPPSTAWESVRFSRPSGSSSSSSSGCCSASVVSRHASLAAAAAETAMMDTGKPSPSGGTISEARSREVKSSSSSSSSSATNTPDKSAQPPPAGSSRSSSPTRRRRVSFAEGTKESPQPNASSPPVPSARGRAAAAKQATAATVAADTGPGRRGGRGRRSGKASSGIGRGGKPAPAPARKSVLGGIVERAPSVPAPMEVRVGGRVQGGAGAVEGHLPKIEADLSFRVMPRGGYPGDGGGDGPGFTGGGGGGVEEAKDAREQRLGVDGGPLTADEVEDEKEMEEEDGVEGEGHREDDADENDRAIWRETFGEEIPAEVSSGSWIDMDAVRDKEMREEFASSIAPFALLWSALSEWVSPETRAVCRAGRAAAAAAAAALAVASPLPSAAKAKTSGLNGRSSSEIGDIAAEPAGSPAITAASCFDVSEQSPRIDSSHSSSASPGHLGSVPADFQARKAGAVAEAIEAEMSRHAKRDRDRRKANPNDSPIKGTGDSSARGGGATVGEGPTLTGALRHTGVSTMVNMHLAPAERALIAAATTLHVRGGGGGGGDGDGRSGILQKSGQHNNVGSRKKWVWSDTATGARQGARMPGGWVEEEGATTAAAAVAAEAVPLKAPPAGGGGKAKKETTGDDIPAVATASGTGKTARGKHADAETNPRESPAITVAGRQTRKAPAAEPAAAAAGEHVAGGGAECRRAVSAVIDTLKVAAGSASSATAADLSIAQWKVVSVVLLTAVGLGAGAIGGGGGGDGEGGAAAPAVTGEEAEVAAEACARLCGAEMGVSAREFRILVDVMLEE